MLLRLTVLAMALQILFLSTVAWSAMVSATRGQQVLIVLEGLSVSIGDQFYLINPASQKKVGLVTIQQVKGPKAVAILSKGRAQMGFTLQTHPSNAANTKSTNSDSTSAPVALRPQYGVLVGFMQNMMTSNISYTNEVGSLLTSSVSMTGNGYSLGGFYDYILNPGLFFEGLIAYEQFDVSGSSSTPICSSSTSCNAQINYLSLYGLLKWYLDPSPKRPWWIGGGLASMFALSKSATALNASDIQVSRALIFGGGMDFAISKNSYVPVILQYNLFPSSPTVSASSLILKTGFSFSF